MIFLLFVYIKTFRKKIGFVYERKLRWLPSSKDNVHAYIHKKQKKFPNVFIYKKSDTFQKARQFPLCFYIQKAIHLTLRDFHEIFDVGIFIQRVWHFLLRDVFIYKKLDTWQRARQFAIRFYIQKSGTFALREFSLNFWNLWIGGDMYSWKNNVLRVTLLYWKTIHFALLC